ncbi:hypothetical protein LHYA1_G003505 [Lachnellula hyalina]|uniref:BTB domain-containing protein n=1 Tax=Lachnellula hyalina TaxID=1316788 RepID=A0A8H8R3W3_9HELO|nr:uncharacterized protein LHYA1_G003505 [Lachnellula hyalina]TVY27944.1 hypothetical protein LHYA1_G003505 [Lachnellula hyalina]
MRRFVQYFPSRFPAPIAPPHLEPSQAETAMNSSQGADASQSASALVIAKKITRRTRKKRPNFRDYHAMVTINITHAGQKEPRKFIVHRDFICHYSPYFDAAFNGDFIEAHTQTLDLDEFWPRVFELFINWIYTQTLCDNRGKTLDICWMVPFTEECALRHYVIATCGASLPELEKDTEYPKDFLIDLFNYARTSRSITSSPWVPLEPHIMKGFLVESDPGSASVFRAVGSHGSYELESTGSAAVA